MKESIGFLFRLIIIDIIAVILIFSIYDYYKEHHGYKYISFKDEIGISRKCYINDKGLFCKVDGGLVEVRQYEKR